MVSEHLLILMTCQTSRSTRLLLLALTLLLTSCASNGVSDKPAITADEIEQYRGSHSAWLSSLQAGMPLDTALGQVLPYQQYFFQYRESGRLFQYSEGKLPVTGILFGLLFEDGRLQSLLLDQDVVDFFYCRFNMAEQARLANKQRGAWHTGDFGKTLAWVRQCNRIGTRYNDTPRAHRKENGNAGAHAVESIIHGVAFAPLLPFALVGMAITPDDGTSDYGQPERLVELASQIEPGVTSKSDLVRILGYPSSNLEKTGIWEYVWPDARFGFVDGIVQWSESRSKYWKAPRNSSTTFKPGYRCEPSGSAIPNNQEQAFDRAPQLPNPAAR